MDKTGASGSGSATSPGRVHFLDSWRGIAAVAVVFFHLIAPAAAAFHLGDSYSFYSRLAFDGTDWVSFFFVLSGFALSYSFIISGKQLDVLDFYVKRIFRIYPLYILAVMLSYILARAQGPYSGMELFRELLLFPRFVKLLVPGWSLSVEIECSLVMPLIIIYALYSRKSFILVALGSLLLYTIAGRQPEESATSFVFHFMLGTYMALLLKEYHKSNIKLPLADVSLPVILLLLLLSYPLFCMRWYIQSVPKVGFLVKLGCDTINMSFHQLFHFISGALSFVIILATLANVRLQKIMSLAPLQFLGKISFGIYIMHYPIITYFFPRLYTVIASGSSLPATISLILIQVIILGLVIACAYLTYIIIEKPFINLGQKVIALPQYNNIKSRLSK